MREISTKFLEVGEHIVVDGVEYVAKEDDGDCEDCDLSHCGRCFLIPCHNGVRLKRVEVPTNGGWHTGTPTEEGWYVCKLAKSDLYETHYYTGNNWSGFFKKWQKIEPYKEASK